MGRLVSNVGSCFESALLVSVLIRIAVHFWVSRMLNQPAELQSRARSYHWSYGVRLTEDRVDKILVGAKTWLQGV